MAALDRHAMGLKILCGLIDCLTQLRSWRDTFFSSMSALLCAFEAHLKRTWAKVFYSVRQASFRESLCSYFRVDLGRMYSLVSRVPVGMTELRKKFQSHVHSQGLSAIEKCGDSVVNVSRCFFSL